jgi:hypothetical protein
MSACRAVVPGGFCACDQLNDATRRQLCFDPSDAFASAGIAKKSARDHLGIGQAHNAVLGVFEWFTSGLGL